MINDTAPKTITKLPSTNIKAVKITINFKYVMYNRVSQIETSVERDYTSWINVQM